MTSPAVHMGVSTYTSHASEMSFIKAKLPIPTANSTAVQVIIRNSFRFFVSLSIIGDHMMQNTEFTIPSGGSDLTLYIETPDGSGSLCDICLDAVQVSKSGKASSVVTGQGTVSASGPSVQPGTGNLSKNDTIRIMPIGDSITFGYGHTGGYRKFLDYYLKDKGYTKVDMVGPEGSNSASFSFNGKNVSYDDNHAGYSGFTIKQQYPIPSWGENGLLEKLKSKNAVSSAQPDIVLLIIGTNDMTANRNLSDCESDLHDLVDYILASMPADGRSKGMAVFRRICRRLQARWRSGNCCRSAGTARSMAGPALRQRESAVFLLI